MVKMDHDNLCGAYLIYWANFELKIESKISCRFYVDEI